MKRYEITPYFDRIASVWDYWHNRNAYYHGHIRRAIGSIVYPGSVILEVGSGTGDLLASLKPSRGIGTNVSAVLSKLAQAKHPHLEFKVTEVDTLGKLDTDFSPDCILLNNMLDYVYDVWDLFQEIHRISNERTVIIITTSNPLWSPLLRLASLIRLRMPDAHRNYLTNKDIAGLVALQGFHVVEETMSLPLPFPIPVIARLGNSIIPELPGIRLLGSLQTIIIRKPSFHKEMRCSIVIPCHNEEGNIDECIRLIPLTDAEIIVVDDGSTDDTRTRVRAVMQMDKRVRLIAFDKNRGKSKAVQAGFEVANGDALMILDADMAVTPKEAVRFFEPLRAGNADFINGTRFVYPMEGAAMRIANFIGNKAFCFLISWVIRQRISDTLCGTKVLFKRDFLKMRFGEEEKWGDFPLIFGAAKLKLRILEIPVHYHERRAGVSKMSVFRDGWLFLWACAKGFAMLRFPGNSHPVERKPVTGWHEVFAPLSTNTRD